MRNSVSLPSCRGKFLVPVLIVGGLVLGLTQAASAQTCLQNEYNQVQHQKLGCTANDVSIAQVTNIRDPATGKTLTSCIAGANFNFLADFTIVTTSSRERENVGLYIATNSTTQALTGTCVDNIISPKHQCPGAATGIFCGSDNYHQDPAIPPPDNCGDTSSNDLSPTGGNGVEIVTLEVDNFACNPPAGSQTLVMPNCTSWQEPGGNIQCVSPPPAYPYPFNGPGGTPTAIPGAPSKCNCGVIPLAITVQTPSINAAKACTTNATPGPPNFTDPANPSPVSCTLTPEGGTVTYTVDLINDKSNFGSVVIDQICDSAYGQVFPATGTCTAGSTGQTITGTTCSNFTIPYGNSQQCTFTANQPENTKVTDTVGVTGHGASAGTFSATTNSVQVVSNEAPTTGTIVKGFSGNTAGCATVRYNVTVDNSSANGTDETLSLSTLNDSAFGNITEWAGGPSGSSNAAVLGTTCGVASGSPGLGTLSGSTGAGALPATIAPNNGTVDGTYTCQFDGQFCSALDPATGCFTHTNTVSATLTNDEGNVVTLTPGTLNLKECLAGSIVTP